MKTDKTPESKRVPITDQTLALACADVTRSLHDRIREKGPGTFASRHEIYGLLAEEMDELLLAVRSQDLSDVRLELLDIAVAAIFGAACIDQKTVEW